ncbi:MAG: glucose-1-phosphate thymidylyltransferase RfbA [Clostridia bacterium]|nr:glucose-1-phosphate thymidylyltransferase RfbA [Clostridia bacterium]
MKGIILTAGNGTRLAPLTLAISKPLLPVYDKPMIYYPLSTLMQAGIKDILIICSEKDLHKYKMLLGDGSALGINLSFEVQKVQRGIADAFIIGEKFIGDDSVCLILGDNLYNGNSLVKQLKNSAKLTKGAEIYGYHVADPERFGVAVLSGDKVVEVEEKPQNPKSDLAITGLYFFDHTVSEIAKNVKPSERGELEITSVINEYIKRKQIKLNEMDNDVVWMDVGTHKSILRASIYIDAVQQATSHYVGCIEEIAFKQGFIDKIGLENLIKKQSKSDYGKYLLRLIEREKKQKK